ncbi:MAG: trypsin-like serine protease, partial [bacterium]|nr:trypsin-like serine protease [bacterium]
FVTAGGGMCSGTLIHPRVVLSAGHCVKLYDASTGTVRDFTDNPNRVSIRTGTSMFDADRVARATEIVTHPTWDGELGTDAADLSLIHLDTALTNTPQYALRDFPVPESGTAGKLVGYGTDGSGSPGSSVHRVGDTMLLNVFSDVIETGGDSNTCEGDSGGPLFTEQDGEWVVTGVTSFGTGDCYEEGGSYSVNVLA